jgi:hypothetical protein
MTAGEMSPKLRLCVHGVKTSPNVSLATLTLSAGARTRAAAPLRQGTFAPEAPKAGRLLARLPPAVLCQ